MDNNSGRARRLAALVTTAMTDAGSNENALAEATQIPRSTLRRKLRTGDFLVTELCTVADELHLDVVGLISDASAA
ncbi:MAG: hypothetical protein ACOH10_12560 [Rhodoglobus sp.]